MIGAAVATMKGNALRAYPKRCSAPAPTATRSSSSPPRGTPCAAQCRAIGILLATERAANSQKHFRCSGMLKSIKTTRRRTSELDHTPSHKRTRPHAVAQANSTTHSRTCEVGTVAHPNWRTEFPRGTVADTTVMFARAAGIISCAHTTPPRVMAIIHYFM